MRRSPHLVAALTAVSLSLTGCGSSEPPTDASVEEFCEVQDSFTESQIPEEGEELTDADRVAGLHDWEEAMSEVGTPEDIPEDARAGLEFQLETTRDIGEDGTIQDFEEATTSLTEEDQRLLTAYGEYYISTCS